MSSQDVLIRIQATPNPAAWKFVLDRAVLNEGKATYSNIQEAEHNPMAKSLFEIDGVRQVHYFQNVITVTHGFDYDSEKIQEQACSVIQTRMPIHNPNQSVLEEKVEKYNGTYNRKLDLSGYARGIYTVQFVTDKFIVTKRLKLN